MNADSSRPFVPWGGVVLVALWIWAIWSCAEHWRVNPNYSYGWAVPLLALGFGIRRYFRTASESAGQLRSGLRFRRLAGFLAALAVGALAFLLEYWREEMWHPQIVLWSICLLAAGSTIAILRICHGPKL